MPTQLVHCPRVPGSGFAQWHRRHRGLMQRIGGIARQAGDTNYAVVFDKIGFEYPVVDRPVIRPPSNVLTRKSDGCRRG